MFIGDCDISGRVLSAVTVNHSVWSAMFHGNTNIAIQPYVHVYHARV